jgi:hypothetical protein
MYRQEEAWIKNGSGARARPQGSAAGADASVVWFRNPSAPSIPTHTQSFGYEQGKDGRLVRQSAPAGGYSGAANDSAGPGDYDNPISAMSKRTTSWSKSQSARDFVRASKTPGPGHYTAPQQAPADEFDEPVPGLSSFTSKTTRGLGGSSKSGGAKKKNLTPGPGAYNARSMFESAQVPTSPRRSAHTCRERRQRVGGGGYRPATLGCTLLVFLTPMCRLCHSGGVCPGSGEPAVFRQHEPARLRD